jgi:hypothetical protein
VQPITKLSRRSFLKQFALIGASSVVPFGLVGCGAGDASSEPGTVAKTLRASKFSTSTTESNLVLTSNLAGQTVMRSDVLVWEARRVQVVANRMSGNLPAAYLGDVSALLLRPPEDISNIVQERNQLADAKMKAGDAAMRQLVAADLLITGLASNVAAVFPQWAICEIDIFSNRGTAEGFAQWFTNHAISLDDERSMLVACPDHYLLHGNMPHSQDVIEVTGGAIEASHFVIDYSDTRGLPIVVDPDFPVRFSGAAMNSYGTVIGGTNHRMRTLAQGFQLHAAIFFPVALPYWFITEHRWHLACEFSNWIEAYIAQSAD